MPNINSSEGSRSGSGLLEAWSAVQTSLPSPWAKKLRVGASAYEEIFTRGNARFVKFTSKLEAPAKPEKKPETPVLILPSLVNRHYILDLLPGKSLVESLLANRFPVYMIMWLNPPDEDRYLSIDDLFKLRILKAIDVAAKNSPTGRVHLVGQCLGGTLASIAASLAPEKIETLSLLTAPIDFSRAGQLGAWANAPGFDLDALVDAHGNVPARFLQTSFQFLKPSSHFSKIKKIIERRKDEDFMVTFAAMELWSNDAVAFPGDCYRFLIRELYQRNRLSEGSLQVCGKTISLQETRFPILDAVATDDHIVPVCTRLKLNDRASITQLDLSGGHIGAVIGSHARKTFWPKWMSWLKSA
ncbi:MAG: alpha/beta fold hydrolase [Proteobacteria bacterium]|nr:MAG: alpha/beta fold hydrolase [Pseudomonadota bacterium]